MIKYVYRNFKSFRGFYTTFIKKKFISCLISVWDKLMRKNMLTW